jgi:hypothetical protein
MPLNWEDMTIDEKWTEIKYQRSIYLARSDWTQLHDVLLTPAEQASWLAYREALQNIEFAFAIPDQVVYPVPPSISTAPLSPAPPKPKNKNGALMVFAFHPHLAASLALSAA